MRTVTFIDTSVLCELLAVPGKSSPAKNHEVRAELQRRQDAGEEFVIPVTAVIETGNHIAQSDGDRYTTAGRLVALLRQALDDGAPWRVLETRLDETFLRALCAGDSTGLPLEALAAHKVGAGDVAILVERDQLVSGSSSVVAQVWTFDAGLAAQAAI